MRFDQDTWPVVYVDTCGRDLRKADSSTIASVNGVLYEALQAVHNGMAGGQGLLKVHIGERKCATRMMPEYTTSSSRFLLAKRSREVVAGDTTVAYSGPRGHKQNPGSDTSQYLELAEKHGWSPKGPAGVGFVVLDRPSSAVKGQFEFDNEEQVTEIKGVGRFKDFYPAGGFAAADFVINHAHVTLHGLAGLAGCVKSIAMGCSSLRGKLRMHQSLLPRFDQQRCTLCQRCVQACPEDALKLNDGAGCPVVDPELCIGCGECQAVCAVNAGAVELHGRQITDWQRGQDTLPVRMADYVMGLMTGKWENTIHVLHMYSVTELCDCVDVRQEPMLKRDLGFLVGKNPFFVDLIAGRMLADALREQGSEIDPSPLDTARKTAAYVRDAYGIGSAASLETIKVS